MAKSMVQEQVLKINPHKRHKGIAVYKVVLVKKYVVANTKGYIFHAIAGT